MRWCWLLMDGWIKLHRLLVNWEWYTTPNMVHFWVHCLLSANHSDGFWRGIPVKKGQFVSGRKSLSANTGLSEQTIRTCIERLKSTSEITIQSTNEYSVFTIISWEKYQIVEPVNQPINQRSTSNQPAINQRSTTNKKEKNDKNEKKNTIVSIPETLLLISGFAETWEEWLRHLSEKKKNPTQSAKTLQLKKLSKMDDPIAAINNSIEKNYQGIFESKEISRGYETSQERINRENLIKWNQLQNENAILCLEENNGQ